MASVLQRPDGSWQLLWREASPSGETTSTGRPVMVRRTEVVHGIDRATALRRANAIEDKRRREGPVKAASKDSLAAFAWNVYMPQEKRRLKIKSYHRQAQLLVAVIRLLDGDALKLAEIKKLHVRLLVEAARAEVWPAGHRLAGLHRNGPRQTHHLFTAFKKLVSAAYDAEAIKFNPRVEGIRPPECPVRGPNVKIASEPDTMALIEAMRAGHPALPRSALAAEVADIVELAFLTALRKGELLGLGWHNISLDPTDGMPPFARIVDVVEEAGSVFRLRHSTKTDHRTGGQGRIVLLVVDAVDLLCRRKAAWESSGIAESGKPAAGAVFMHPLTGDYWPPNRVSSVVRVCANRLGLTAGIHSRRHGAITALRKRGVAIEVVSAFAGHSDTKMTQVQYGWIDAEMQQRQLFAVENGNGSAKALPAPAGLSSEVMLAALDYAKTSGLALGEVIAMLTGKVA